MSNEQQRKRALQAQEDARAQWANALKAARAYRDDHPFEAKLPKHLQRRLDRAQRNYQRTFGR